MIIQNAIFIPEEDYYLYSSHQHDFVTFTARDDKELFLDGGNAYRRMGGDLDLIKWEDFSLNDSDPFEKIVERKLWGTRGKDGKKQLRYRPLNTFTVDHLKAIQENCPYASPLVRMVVTHLLGRMCFADGSQT